jgi:hypothetical protein
MKPLALWACPRSVSTAFEVMMMQRGDVTVLHEPFGPSYYYSEDRQSDRKNDISPKPEFNYSSVLRGIIDRSKKNQIFFKDMAYCVMPRLGRDFVSQFTNTFLIRDPRDLLPSLYRKWPDFTLEEAGYTALGRLFDLAHSVDGRPPVVIDADDLCLWPEHIVKAYCEATGLQFRPESLQWEARARPQLAWWEGGSWHETVQTSRGFLPPDKSADGAVEAIPATMAAYEVCRPIYDRLRALRLTG